MEQYALYLVLKDIINELGIEQSITFNDMDDNGHNCIGIYVKGDIPTSYRNISTGNYYNYSARVQVLMNGDLSNDGLMGLLSNASLIRDKLVTMNNTVHECSDKVTILDGSLVYNRLDDVNGIGVVVRLSTVSLLGEVRFEGKNSQGLPRYSINFKIYYSIGGKENG